MFNEDRSYPNWTSKLEYQHNPAGEVIGVGRPSSFWARRVAAAGTPARSSFWKGLQWGAEGSMVGLPFIALEAGMAQRGEMLSTLAARGTGLMTYPAITGVTAAGLTLLFPELKAVGFIAGILGMYPDSLVQNGMLRGFRTLTEAGRHLHHLELGGTYQDTATAQSHRLSALHEMSGALGASRRYLGQEAALMHR